MRKIKNNDEVIIIAGKDKSRANHPKTGRVIKVLDDGERVIVEGINMIKKHVRPNPQKQEQGGIVEREAPIHISNVALYNPQTKKADKVGIKTLKDGTKVRYFKSTGEQVNV